MGEREKLRPSHRPERRSVPEAVVASSRIFGGPAQAHNARQGMCRADRKERSNAPPAG